ncbi:SDR family oxidoreductase [Actinoplanes sp. TBRC 11911]|uniref:SDR family oxidoreductase n=1 Tax=Actinoplanes sp. TBRC 11911 TaxID=2729386 RepID=UPI00145EBBA4|nr:SDR family oxidoreductase [Actinoplanes sp. TBRC 11911]NMO49705.1 SDR family oxidoreductase [Actinoplanes sp. TBRC 11911]
MEETTHTRTWLVTGASSGVGQAVAVAALERGDRVAAMSRSTMALRQLSIGFRGQALALPADVRDEAALSEAVERTTGAFGGIDVVVNAAGYALLGPIEEISDKKAHENFDTNFFGVLNVLRAVLPVLRAQRSGHVVQMSSIFGHMSYPGTGLLAATKHAVGAVTEALALELAPYGITFSIMEPGAVRTRFMAEGDIVAPGAAYPEVGDVVRQLTDLPPHLMLGTRELAEAIIGTADAARPPLRVALGPGAADEIRKALDGRLRALSDGSAT